MTPFQRSFLGFIRAYTRTRGISVGEFARIIGRSERTAYRIINGETQLRIENMEHVLKCLGHELRFVAEEPTEANAEANAEATSK